MFGPPAARADEGDGPENPALWVQDGEGHPLPLLDLPSTLPTGSQVVVEVRLRFAGLRDTWVQGPYTITEDQPLLVDVPLPEDPTVHPLQRAFATEVSILWRVEDEASGTSSVLDGPPNLWLVYPPETVGGPPALMTRSALKGLAPNGVTDPARLMEFLQPADIGTKIQAQPPIEHVRVLPPELANPEIDEPNQTTETP